MRHLVLGLSVAVVTGCQGGGGGLLRLPEGGRVEPTSGGGGGEQPKRVEPKRKPGKRVPSDLTNKFSTASVGASFAQWEGLGGFRDIDHNELTCEDGIGGKKAAVGDAGDIILGLLTMTNGEDVIKILSGDGFIYVGQRRSWGRIEPDGSFKSFENKPYRISGKQKYSGKDYTYTLTIANGRDSLGARDTVFSVSCSGRVLSATLQDLHRARAEGILARAEKRGYYKGVQDSEGYTYLLSLSSCDVYRATFWDPFLFEPSSVKQWRSGGIDARTLRPVATLEFLWDKPGTHGNSADFAKVRNQVYGIGGAPDILRVGFRTEKDGYQEYKALYLDGGNPETDFRKAQHHLARARKLSESYNDEDKAQAVVEYTQALKFDSACAEAYYGRAFAASRGFYDYGLTGLSARDLKRFLEDLQTAMELDVKHRTEAAYRGLAAGRIAANDLAGAEVAYTEAIRVNRKSAENFRSRQKIREKLEKMEAAREDEMEATRLETEDKREQERKKQEAIAQAEQQRREAPDRFLVEAGVARWSYDTSAYATFEPPFDRKVELLQRRLKDVNERPIIVQMIGEKAEYGAYPFENFGFKILKGKKADTEEKISLIVESNSDGYATLKTGQDRKLEDISSKDQMTAAFRAVQVMYLKDKLDWQSEKYADLASYWEKLAQKTKDNDEAAVLEALEEILRLDPEDKGAMKLKLDKLEAAKDWKSFEAECTRQLGSNAGDLALRERRLQANARLGHLEKQLEDLGILTDKTTSDYSRQNWLMRRAEILTELARHREAADVWTKLVDKSPDDPNLYVKRAEAYDRAGDSYSAQQSRARALEINRLYSKHLPYVLAGVASWQDQQSEVVIRPELVARLNMAPRRYADPEEKPLQIFVSGGSLSGALEKAGFAVRLDDASGCDVSVKVTKTDATLSLTGGASMTLSRVDAERVLNALAAWAAVGKLGVFTAAYEKLIQYEEKRLAAARMNDYEAIRAIRHRIAVEFPSKWAVVADYLDAVRYYERGNEERVLKVTADVLARDEAWRQASQKAAGSDPYATSLWAQIRAYTSLGRHADILRAYDRLLEAAPKERISILNSKCGYLKEAGEYRAAAQAKAAVAELQAKELDGTYRSSYLVTTLHELSDLMKAAGDEAGARDAARRAASVAFTDVSLLMQRAEQRAARSDFGGAMADANEAFQKAGGKADANLHYRRAAIRFKRGDAEGALDDYTRGLAIAPTEEAYVSRAAILEKLERKPEAASDRREAWKLPLGDYAYSYSYRADRRLRAGDRDGAFDDWQKAADLSRGDERAEYIVMRALGRASVGDNEGAMKDADLALKECRTDAKRLRCLDARIDLRIRSGDQAAAVSDLGETIRIEESWRRLLRRARAQIALGKKDLAQDDIRWVQSLTLPPGDLDSVARELKELGDVKGAVELFTRALDVATEPSQRVDTLLRRARFKKWYLGDYAGALADLDLAMQAGPSGSQRATVLDERISTRDYLKDKAGVVAELDALIAIDETWSRVLRRARTLRELGQGEKCDQDVQRARQLAWSPADADSLCQAFLDAGAPKVALETHDMAVERVTVPSQRAQRLWRRAVFKWTVLDDLTAAIADADAAIQSLRASTLRAGYLDQRALMKVAKADYSGAIEDVSQAMAAEETAPRLLHRAKLQILVGNRTAADEDIAKVRSLPVISSDWDRRANDLAGLGDVAAALETYDKALASGPADYTKGSILVNRAFISLSAGDAPAALESIKSALSAYPSNRQGYLQTQLSLHMALGDIESSLRVTDEMLKLTETLDWRLQRARLLRALGRNDEAAADIKKALTQPWDVGAAHTVAWNVCQAGDPKAALDLLEQAFKRAPAGKKTDVLRSRASLRRAMGEPDAAEKDCEEALKVRDESATRELRASLRADRGDKDGAMADLQAAAALDPQPNWTRVYVLRELGDAEAARRAIEQMIAWAPGYYWNHAQKADVLFEAGDLDGAVKAADRALAAHDDLTAKRVRALAACAKGDKTYPRLVANSCMQPATMWVRAEICLALGENDEAVRCARLHANAYAQNILGWMILARACLAKGDKAQAMESVRKAMQIGAGGSLRKKLEDLKKQCE